MMQYRELTAARLRVSRMGLGLAALGRPGYITLGHGQDMAGRYDTAAMEEHTFSMLDAAWQAGIRYFDVARSYGRAEKFLGSWLRGRNISEGAAVVGSKWGYTYTANWQVQAREHEVKQHSLQQLDKQREESNLLLGGYLDLYQIHSATLESGVLDNKLVLDRLHALKMHGLLIGLTLSGPRQAETLQRALEIRFGGERLFDVVQATWNLLEQSAGPALAQAHAAGLGILVKEGLANGRLTTRNQEAAFADKRALLQQLSDETGYSFDALALAAILAQPWADVVLSGAATPEQLRSNLVALRVGLTPEQLQRLQGLAEEPERYWTTRSQLEWN
ncbi:aldo/keto reductase [Cesiribacter andamanensis]|uniref:Pyridoxal 4-dehydrogenase n=1 Tax=Cesiribacter andamanensis AMV16 TaxID=1279009 RepID=M7N2G6_9BACT|nr:aldo/keto reductase [Cesiribacter andamanensis]EMR02858.1 Pyridoxal 4-dehydrogenase [Cesiribacter andamanensis AMV16]